MRRLEAQACEAGIDPEDIGLLLQIARRSSSERAQCFEAVSASQPGAAVKGLLAGMEALMTRG